jgi:hypothetical protein
MHLPVLVDGLVLAPVAGFALAVILVHKAISRVPGAVEGHVELGSRLAGKDTCRGQCGRSEKGSFQDCVRHPIPPALPRQRNSAGVAALCHESPTTSAVQSEFRNCRTDGRPLLRASNAD